MKIWLVQFKFTLLNSIRNKTNYIPFSSQVQQCSHGLILITEFHTLANASKHNKLSMRVNEIQRSLSFPRPKILRISTHLPDTIFSKRKTKRNYFTTVQSNYLVRSYNSLLARCVRCGGNKQRKNKSAK